MTATGYDTVNTYDIDSLKYVEEVQKKVVELEEKFWKWVEIISANITLHFNLPVCEEK